MPGSLEEGDDRGLAWTRLRRFIAGYVSGGCLVLAGHPFDTIKVRMQTGVKGQPPTLRGVYRGVGPPLLTTGAVQAVNFGLFSTFKGTLEAHGQWP